MNDLVGPVVIGVDEQTDLVIEVGRWTALAEAALRSEGVVAGELNLLFVGLAEMRDLNLAHMGKDRPTDVLSFPLDGADASGAGAFIGDVVICPAEAARNAPDHVDVDHHTGSVDDELALLVVHGVLHVVGHDHVKPDDAAPMEALEQMLLEAHYR